MLKKVSKVVLAGLAVTGILTVVGPVAKSRRMQHNEMEIKQFLERTQNPQSHSEQAELMQPNKEEELKG